MNKKLKLALIASGRPQFEIAVKAKISETKLSRIVRGRVQPTSEEISRIASALDVSPQKLFGNVRRDVERGGESAVMQGGRGVVDNNAVTDRGRTSALSGKQQGRAR